MNFKGVLFDLDGVLLKSMEQHLEAWRAAFVRFKATVREKDFYQLEGRGVNSVVTALVEMYKIDPRYKDEILKEKIKNYNKIFKPMFYDGIFELLDNLKSNNVKMAVVTGGMRERVNGILDNHFPGYFAASITSDDVRETKPFPEPYLKGASLLGLAPAECIVIENAPMGISAGKEAGMFVIAITTTLTRNYLEKADLIVNSLDEINTYLQIKIKSTI